jgi:hypothetical protein
MSGSMLDGNGLCQEISGFLFRHRCDRFAQGQCEACGKPVCLIHGHFMADGRLQCTGCVKQSRNTSDSNSDGDSSNDSSGNVAGGGVGRGGVGGGGGAGERHGGDRDSSAERPSSTQMDSDPVFQEPYLQGEQWYRGFGSPRAGGSRRLPSSATDKPGPAGENEDVRMEEDAESVSGHDADDFTEGDAASFVEEGDESFETDLGES